MASGCKITFGNYSGANLFMSQGFSQGEILHELKLSNKTVTEWTNFFCESCISTVIDNSAPIGGNGVEVEIDESKFGKRKYHKGHKVEGQWVFGGHEKYNKKYFYDTCKQ